MGLPVLSRDPMAFLIVPENSTPFPAGAALRGIKKKPESSFSPGRGGGERENFGPQSEKGLTSVVNQLPMVVDFKIRRKRSISLICGAAKITLFPRWRTGDRKLSHTTEPTVSSSRRRKSLCLLDFISRLVAIPRIPALPVAEILMIVQAKKMPFSDYL